MPCCPLWVKVTGPWIARGSSSTRVGGTGSEAAAGGGPSACPAIPATARPAVPARKARRATSGPQPSSLEHMGFASSSGKDASADAQRPVLGARERRRESRSPARIGAEGDFHPSVLRLADAVGGFDQRSVLAEWLGRD